MIKRRNIEKSTRAACKYLRNLYAQFGDWYLAFAAYNCGVTRVLKEMKRSKSSNFWDLKRLPSQTRNYVPKILAIFMSFLIYNCSKLNICNKLIKSSINLSIC